MSPPDPKRTLGRLQLLAASGIYPPQSPLNPHPSKSCSASVLSANLDPARWLAYTPPGSGEQERDAL